ncbi:hypothetical protein ACLB2K_011972 [Fragaria x ananassa]
MPVINRVRTRLASIESQGSGGIHFPPWHLPMSFSVMGKSCRLHLHSSFRRDFRGKEMKSWQAKKGLVLLSRLPFGYKRLWNDDFDPFMVALKNVKEEKKEKASAASASYVANNQSTNEPAGDDEDSTTSAQEPISKEMGAQIVPKRQLAEPKGVEFARQVRLIQMGQMSKLDKLGKQSERDEKAESTRKKPTFLRKLNFKSGRAATCEEEKRVSHPRPHSQLSKMVLMHYKPRGIPCLGYN